MTFRHWILIILTLVRMPVVTVAQTAEAPPDTSPPESAAPAHKADAVRGRKAHRQAQFADAFYGRGEYDMAAAEYAALVRKFPDFEQLPQAYFLWAESLRLK